MSEFTRALKEHKRIDISSELTPEFFVQAKRGQVLKFNQDGQIRSFKIVRLNRKSKKCEVVPTALYTEDQVNVVDREK